MLVNVFYFIFFCYNYNASIVKGILEELSEKVSFIRNTNRKTVLDRKNLKMEIICKVIIHY